MIFKYFKKKDIFYLFILLIFFILIVAIITSVRQMESEFKLKLKSMSNQLKINNFEMQKINLSRGIINNKIFISYIDGPELKNKYKRPYGYLEIVNNKIIFISGDGSLYIIENNFFKEIDTNLKDLINIDFNKEDYDNQFHANKIRDILYVNGNIYIVANYEESNAKKIQPTILKAKFSNEKMNFDFFFKSDYIADESFVDYTHTGGRLVYNEIEDIFYFAIPDYGSPIENKVSVNDGIYGKIIKLENNGNYEVISWGHRNPQGLFFDKEKNILIESEHGPSGGDEINLIKQNKNYGWPTTSFGDGGTVEFHDHKGQGFEAPIFTWVDNPGVSEIIKIPNDSELYFKNKYILSSLSGSQRGPEKYSGLHLYIFDIIEGKYQFSERIFVNDRIRDIKYNSNDDTLYLVLETGQKIAQIKPK